MKKWIVTVALAGLSALAWALPTLQDVQAEVDQGRYARAEEMMREVVAAKPESAKAHYVYAEILAHQRKLGLAAEEAKTARQIDPDIKFTDAAKFRSFEAALLHAENPGAGVPIGSERGRAVAPARVAPATATGVPSWVWLAGIVAVGLLLWRGLSRSRSQGGALASPGAYGAAGGAYGTGTPAPMGTTPYGPGYPGYPPQRGSGMLGTGLAAAGGVAAGMLASELLHRRDGATGDAAAGGQPGFFDSPQPDGAAELEDRPIDFGSGGDWDAGSGDIGGGDGGGWD